jgi:hypothetical protein
VIYPLRRRLKLKVKVKTKKVILLIIVIEIKKIKKIIICFDKKLIPANLCKVGRVQKKVKYQTVIQKIKEISKEDHD